MWALVFIFISTVSALAEPVYFADANLKAAVEAKLGISNPTSTDMLSLTVLDNWYGPITDLTGLEYATNLMDLVLYNNQISDISALSGLTNLKGLELHGNPLDFDALLSTIPYLISQDIAVTYGPTSLLTISAGYDVLVTDPGDGTFQCGTGYEAPISASPRTWPSTGSIFWTGTAVDAGMVADPMSASTTVIIDDDYTLRANFAADTGGGPVTDAAIYVDDDAETDPGLFNPAVSDPLEDGSPEHPYDTVQKGIDATMDGETVLVLPGVYFGSINMAGKAITVTSLIGIDSSAPDALGIIDDTVLYGNGPGSVVVFDSGEGPDCVLKGFTIIGGSAQAGGGILCENTSPTISHCVIAGNRAIRYGSGGVNCYHSGATFVNCTIADNYAAESGGDVSCEQSNDTFVNCIIWGNTPDDLSVMSGNDPIIRYCDIGQSVSGTETLQADPYFASPGYWARAQNLHVSVDPTTQNAVWVHGDYHLQSQFGRFDPVT